MMRELGLDVVRVGHGAHDAQRLAATRRRSGASGDERHLARVVDLRQARQLAARQLAARAEEAQPHVLGLRAASTKARCCGSSSGRIGRSSERLARATAPSPPVRPGTGGSRSVRRPRWRSRLTRTRASSAITPSWSAQQRVDVELGELGQVGQHLRHRDQHVADGVEVGRRMVAIAGQQLGDARARRPARAPARGSAAAARSRGRPAPRRRCRPGRTAAPGRTPGRRWRRRSAPAPAAARPSAAR